MWVSKFIEWLMVIALAAVLVAIVVLLWAIPVWLAWNAVVPDLFGLSEITLKQSAILTLLAKMLFSGVNFNKK